MTATDDPVWNLDPDDLASRYGFNDGDFPKHVWPIEFVDEIPDPFGWHDVLYRIVERYVIPTVEIPDGYELRYIMTAHNPARLKDDEGDEPWDWECHHKVPVRLSQARTILQELVVDEDQH